MADQSSAASRSLMSLISPVLSPPTVPRERQVASPLRRFRVHGPCIATSVGTNYKEDAMARKYSRGASKSVKSAMRRRKRGSLKSGRSGKKVTSRKQAIAIGRSEARKKGARVPRKRGGRGRRKKSKSS